MDPALRHYLEGLVDRFERPKYIQDDPIAVPHGFDDPRDQEVIGLYAALLAWGRRDVMLRKLEEQEDEIEELRPELEALSGSVDRGRHPFEVLRSRRPVWTAMEELLDAAQDEVVIGLPGDVLEQVETPLRAAIDRGVLVLLLCSGVEELPLDPRGLATVVRTRRHWSPAAVAVDTDRAGLVPPEELFRTANPTGAAVRITQPNVVYLVRSALLGQEWPLGREAHAAAPAALPAQAPPPHRACAPPPAPRAAPGSG